MIEIIGYISIAFFWLTGLVIWVSIFRPIKNSAIIDELGFDTSNRINRLRLLWLCLRRPWLFVGQFAFLTMDEHEQVVYLNKMRGRK